MNGVIVRQYAYCGEQGAVYWDSGPETEEEAQLRRQQEEELREVDEEEQSDEDEGSIIAFMPGESDVMVIAGTWSLDPTMLDKIDLKPDLGQIGGFSSKL